MDELGKYELQLSQVESLLEIDASEELIALKNDLKEVIELMQSSSSQASNSLGNLKSEKSIDELSSTIEIKQEKDTIILDSDNESDENDQIVDQSNQQKMKQEIDLILLDDQDIDDYNQLIGETYFVPYLIDDCIEMHEAEIIRIIEINEDGDATLLCKMLFPLNDRMKYCSKCKANNQNCSFNHGHLVNLSMIKDSLYSDDLKLNSNCLYHEKDEAYWIKGKIIDKMESDLFRIRSDLTQELITVKLNDIRLFDEDNRDEKEENDNSIEINDTESSTDELSDFKEYSNFGLKYLQKFGYEIGQGLGPNKNGIVNPVRLSIYPANTSLDTCMELKEKGYLCTSSDRFSHEKQKHYFKNLILKKNFKKKIKKQNKKDEVNVFHTLNQTIATKKKAETPICIYSKLKSVQQETKNTKNVNVDIFNIEQETKKNRIDIQYLQKSINLCKEMNPSNLKNLNAKLKSKENELCMNELKLKVLKEKKKRKDYDRNIKYF